MGVNPYAPTWHANRIVGSTALQGGGASSVQDAMPQQRTFLGQPTSWIIGAVIVLGVLKYMSEHPKFGVEPGAVRVDGYNIFTIFLVWAVAYTLIKLGVNWAAPNSGAAQYVNWL